MAQGRPFQSRLRLLAVVCFTACTGLSGPASAGGAELAYLAFTDGYWQVWTLDADGGSPRQVTRSSFEKARCSWFPDGRHLLVAALDGRVFRVNLETGAESQVPVPLSGSMDAVLSPDGTRIAFSRTTPGSADDNDVWLVRLDGTGLRKLITMPWLQHDPQWDADGERVYFLSGDGRQDHDIWRVAIATGATDQLTTGALYHFDLAVARDGTLAFSSNRSGDYEIYSQREGEAPVRRTQHAGLDGGPTWSPDGRSLVFHSTRSGGLQLWRVDEGGPPRQLTHHADGARGAVWRPAVGADR